jgi:FKBP-type peptidyl-prolyl cis-trans isomerase FkpA
MNRYLLPIWMLCVLVSGCAKTQSNRDVYLAQAAKDDKIVANYIAANNLTAVAQKVSDTCGVYYIILQQGQGNDIFTSSTAVTVGDTGRLLGNSTPFTETNEFHPSFILGQVILGWQLGIPKVKRGGTIRLLMPSRYAYGPYAQPQVGLPANAILDFDITLYDITN